MRNNHFIYSLILGMAMLLLLNACSPAKGDHPGDEYMPDMYHSIAYEANYEDYYWYNTWGSKEEYYKVAKPREPINGTVPRGYAGMANATGESQEQLYAQTLDGNNGINAIAVPVNGSVPYPYENNEDERTRATAEILKNPYPITEEGLAKGKELYDIFCGICHGESGNGIGYLVNEEKNKNVKYLAQPANFLNEEFLAASEGRYYHAIMYGKNVMGAYKDKMNYEERWQVIHYIRSLQAKELKLTYDEKENTLNESGVPGVTVANLAMKGSAMADEQFDWSMPEAAGHHEGDHHGEEGHHDDAHHGDDAHGAEHGEGEHKNEGGAHEGDHHHDGDHTEEGHGH